MFRLGDTFSQRLYIAIRSPEQSVCFYAGPIVFNTACVLRVLNHWDVLFYVFGAGAIYSSTQDVHIDGSASFNDNFARLGGTGHSHQTRYCPDR